MTTTDILYAIRDLALDELGPAYPRSLPLGKFALGRIVALCNAGLLPAKKLRDVHDLNDISPGCGYTDR